MNHAARAALSLAFSLPLASALLAADAPAFAPQQFDQEVASTFSYPAGLDSSQIQLVLPGPDQGVRLFAGGRWHGLNAGRWQAGPVQPNDSQFEFTNPRGESVAVEVPWSEVRHLVQLADVSYVATSNSIVTVTPQGVRNLDWPKRGGLTQMALSPGGELIVASTAGLFRRGSSSWDRLQIADGQGRAWAAMGLLGTGFDVQGRLWFATRAGAACRTTNGWSFFEGKDGVPWTEFTGVAPSPKGDLWFGTRLGAVRFDGRDWHYYQGPRWLPHDQIQALTVDAEGTAWFATPAGIGALSTKPMTLADKAAYYESEIERYIKRTPFGFVAEAPLAKPGDRATANPQDSDNDGLWTAMYGAGQCFAFAATGNDRAKARARAAFEALRFLQKVTQGGSHSPPKGYAARTVRPVEWPDPNVGRLAADREQQTRDRLWKVYEPRWPKSADGKWFWKSDTSSDELDGHFFFYPLYYDFCADTESERERVKEVVRDLADHLVGHDFALVDHDGKPTRWGVYRPQSLNFDPNWWVERGLNSLSILSYLAVASHVTGDAKYNNAARELVERHGYAQNAMYPKAQHGPGSGNQSDDEMAYMCYYNLLRYSKDENLKQRIRYSLYLYWVNDAPEMNPFFNFVCAAANRDRQGDTPYGPFDLTPWPGWHEDSMATLRDLPLDRLNWSHRNSHRLDIALLPPTGARDIEEPSASRSRGARTNGKVLAVRNRHFNHWNTDPWQLDYGGNGGELAAGTVFLLPYYMGLYHEFIEKP